ncbi:hypothetical protein TraAM80_08264 [Trypanosoma rangeli]|uniref:Uncharacterized protein n=1 Tax=Trypanosoma rangeli TaxID=5698 RepID=A0A422N1G1_TRYRA|nr:uncharacterized protein TraAM80_08264 [Trypanosoma rangeli]RNE99295.1 hypothetical protein TraAM80_08264 [Trypanosoma rangeli]|eukprot:RNE99295.1 hypothetical protein TraAM80_08264 [Trypanosoma rangeli]
MKSNSFRTETIPREPAIMPLGQRRPSSKSRRLIEEYRHSVLASGGEPMAEATSRAFLERGGCRKSTPFDVRREGSQRSMLSAPPKTSDPVQWCMDHAEAAESAGQLADAEKYLQGALEKLQHTGIIALGEVHGVSTHVDAKLEQDCLRTAEVLRRFGKLSMKKSAYAEALALFNLSSRTDPLTPVTYALRGACHEYLGNYAEAYEEYKKYLSLSHPTMDVMAHTGQCALKAGQYEAAERYLYELLRMTKLATSSPAQLTSHTCTLFDSPSFYEAHAYYCLGLVREKQSEQAAATPSVDSASNAADVLAQEARAFYDLAVANSAYVAALEDAAESAIAVGDTSLTWENLQHLQRLRSDCAHYYLRAADVCAMANDAAAEVAELSKALDQRQPVPVRCTTLLRRAAVYASKLQNFDKAIVDLSLLLSLPGDDNCTAMAYLQRAKAFEQRSCERPRTAKEDVVAALSDYNSFVATALMHPQKLAAPPESITEAMLILANGAFTEKKYACAAHFFARAVARGWQPHEDLPQESQQLKKGTSASSISLTGVDLLTKMYVAIAHNVVSRIAIAEDMFRVAYEQREKSAAHVAVDLKKSKAAERKEAEKPIVPVPAVSYQVVEEHYLRLRALEPTVFSSLQYELLELWEPYRTEVERLREDLMLTRSGRKIKRR